MNFPGKNTLTLSNEAMMLALEGALNAARKDGEDYVRVTDISREYSHHPWSVVLTTDQAVGDVTELMAA